MALVRRQDVWDPFRDLVDLQDEINRVFNRSLAANGGRATPAETAEWLPGVDIHEEKDRFVVRADLPGMKQEEISVEVVDDVLTIRGERKREHEAQEGQAHRIERSHGVFIRSFTLPQTVDANRVNASYKNGVLEISLAKRDEVKPKQIKVQVN